MAERLHVVAGIVRDAAGRVLLAQRPPGRDWAGYWEFPGGKVEKGESPQQALARELGEELGIRAEIGAALMAVPQALAQQRILLDSYCIAAWQGMPEAREGQTLAWVALADLPHYPMPPADRPIVAALLQSPLYLVTPSPAHMRDADWLDALQAALDAGILRLQLRAAGCAAARWQTLVAEAVKYCRQYRAEVLVNADAALAERHGIGLHLPAAQLMQRRERGLDRSRLLAASCHNASELRQAEAIGCDFAVLGHVCATPSHPDAPALGWQGFATLRECTALPLYAIGGLAPADLAQARRHGAQGIAAIRALWPVSGR